MKVYISGKITGNPGYEEEFALREKTLRDNGYLVINPVTEGKRLQKKLGKEPTWDEYIELSLKLIDECDGVSYLSNWKDSKGARIEHDYAVEHNKVTLHVHVLSPRW